MKKIIDIDSWKRKDHFNLFSASDDPYFGMTMMVDFTNTYYHSRDEKKSYFLCSLHSIMTAVNAVEEFRYRIEDGKVVCYDTIHVASTVGRKDGTFAFSFFEYFPDLDKFIENASQMIARVNETSGLMLSEQTQRNDAVHYSAIPWIRFTDLKHTATFGRNDSITKISTGKFYWEGEKLMMPVSVTASHALMDGYHIARFLDILEKEY